VTAKRLLNQLPYNSRLSQISPRDGKSVSYQPYMGSGTPGHRRQLHSGRISHKGTTKPLLPGEENFGMSMATFKLNIKNYFNTLANTHWKNAPQCRISHQTWPVINNKKTSELLKLSPTECGMLIRALTGH